MKIVLKKISWCKIKSEKFVENVITKDKEKNTTYYKFS